MKTFSGTVIENGRSRACQCTYFVRYLQADIESDAAGLQAELLDNGTMQCASVGKGRILAVDADAMFHAFWKKLDADIFSLLKRRPVVEKFHE